jgi:MoaA/NifB/PqqE/SkfB family radical SAM enzyme
MTAEHNPAPPKYKFADLLADSAVRSRWERVRKYFFLRESTYDMTSRCNIRCDGCYYYAGDKQYAADTAEAEAWRRLMRDEKARGITFVVLAGAEPALVPEILQACYDELPLGCIATNGLKRIEDSVGYKIHVSVWGNDATSLRVRKHKDMLEKQIDNYRGDSRAVFVYTYTRENIEEAGPVLDLLAAHDCKVTFNVFSAPVGYAGPLRHTQDTLGRMRRAMLDLLEAYPRQVLFSPYSAVAHSHGLGLHGLYGCPYPRMNPSTDIGLGRSFRQYRSDLTWDRSASCCVPDTDCADCRHYAAGSAVVTSKLYRHAIDPDTFRAWLDYVDTYLAVWVTGYEKGENLCKEPVDPPQS